MASPSLSRRPLAVYEKYYFEITQSNSQLPYKILKNELRTGLCNVLYKFNLFLVRKQVLVLVFLDKPQCNAGGQYGCALVQYALCA